MWTRNDLPLRSAGRRYDVIRNLDDVVWRDFNSKIPALSTITGYYGCNQCLGDTMVN